MKEQPSNTSAFSTTGPTLEVRRVYPVAATRIFEAWTTPQMLEKWFKPFGQAVKVVNLDFREGGSFQFATQMPGRPTSTVTGTYLEIKAPQRLVFTWFSPGTDNKETLVSIFFEERDHGSETEVILTHSQLYTSEMLLKHTQGWQTSFEELMKYYN